MKIEKLKMSIVFAWYDFWVGAYYDRKSRALYIFPVPMVGLRISRLNFQPATDAEVIGWAQATLTALNVGDVKSGSPLHLKLPEL
jgi:hypothetical protein